MKRIVIPPQRADIPLPFYLSVEEWVAKNMPEGEYFFAWQVNPTVICGRHQDIPVEVNLDFAEKNGIFVCRRKSGGGSVYADRSNVMFSYITPSDAVQTTFGRYTSMIVDMLGSLGIEAESTGRNDISIHGRKVAGNAFLKLPGRSIVHGTMLYDADFETMAGVLTPSRAKTLSKGVVSVPSRVTTLREEGLAIGCADFMEYAAAFLCNDGEYCLTDADISEIHEIMKTYRWENDFIPSGGKSTPLYIEGVGEMCIDFIEASDGRICGVNIRGDFFSIKDFGKALNDTLIGKPCRRKEIEEALISIPVETMVVGLTHEKLFTLLPNN